MAILGVYDSRTGFQELLRAPRQQCCRGTFRKEKQRSKPLLRFFARASRPVTAKTRGARPDDKSFVRGPKGELVPLRITNPSDSGHVRLAVRRGTGDNSSKQLGCCTFLMQRRPTLDASTGPCKPLSWQAVVLYRFKATTGRVPPARA